MENTAKQLYEDVDYSDQINVARKKVKTSFDASLRVKQTRQCILDFRLKNVFGVIFREKDFDSLDPLLVESLEL